MKVVGINGSPRKGGNTELLIKEVFKPLEANNIETEFVQLGGLPIKGCTACGACRKNPNGRCYVNGDEVNEVIKKMVEADGIILGTPTYFAEVSTEIKALIDVAGYVTRGNGHQLARKVGAGVCAVRRAGSINALDTINNFFLINQMVVPGSIYWNMGYGKAPGDVLNDKEGLDTMKCLGENMSWLLSCVEAKK